MINFDYQPNHMYKVEMYLSNRVSINVYHSKYEEKPKTFKILGEGIPYTHLVNKQDINNVYKSGGCVRYIYSRPKCKQDVINSISQLYSSVREELSNKMFKLEDILQQLNLLMKSEEN